jgi:DNA-3-methyladenine glycosylase II
VESARPVCFDIYPLMALRRADAWPVGDLALALAAQSVKRLAVTPTPAELDALGAALAARILWHHYLTRRRRPGAAPA